MKSGEILVKSLADQTQPDAVPHRQHQRGAPSHKVDPVVRSDLFRLGEDRIAQPMGDDAVKLSAVANRPTVGVEEFFVHGSC